MTYRVHSIFDTLQGEGGRSGARSIFVRLSGCNAWNGRPQDRHKGKAACAKWCDTSFATGDAMRVDEIVSACSELWPSSTRTYHSPGYVVITGGEPCLQLEESLVQELHRAAFYVAVETNGSVESAALSLADWVTVSPKKGLPMKVTHGNELKVVYPGAVDGAGWTEADLKRMSETTHFNFRYIQPQDVIDADMVERTYLHGNLAQITRKVGGAVFDLAQARSTYDANLKACVDFAKRNGDWRVSIQSHKLIGVP